MSSLSSTLESSSISPKQMFACQKRDSGLEGEGTDFACKELKARHAVQKGGRCRSFEFVEKGVINVEGPNAREEELKRDFFWRLA